MRAAVIDTEGTVRDHRTLDTPHDGTGPGALERLAADVLEGSGVTSAVVGVPGRVDYERGTVGYAPNLPPGWIAELTTDALGTRWA